MEKKFDFKKLGEGLSEKAKSGIEIAKKGASKAKETVSTATESIIQSIDQTGDGKFDMEDISEIKRQLQEKQRQAKLNRDKESLNPIFLSNLSDSDFLLSKMIRLAEMDKKHASSSICKGSIGHETLVKDLRIITIYNDHMSDWDLQFYPDKHQDFYYVDPTDPKQYIAIDFFFDYLRQARVGELQRIAQDLGATYFRVTIKEQRKMLHKKNGSGNLAGVGKLNGKLHSEYSAAENDLSEGEIAAQTSFAGHAPIRPNLVYYKKEPQIKALIEMRTDNTENGVTEQHLSLKCAHSSGITENIAASIDAAFTAMKCTGNTTFTSEAQNETRQVFEYDITF